jgi:hypothetical protein
MSLHGVRDEGSGLDVEIVRQRRVRIGRRGTNERISAIGYSSLGSDDWGTRWVDTLNRAFVLTGAAVLEPFTATAVATLRKPELSSVGGQSSVGSYWHRPGGKERLRSILTGGRCMHYAGRGSHWSRQFHLLLHESHRHLVFFVIRKILLRNRMYSKITNRVFHRIYYW